MVNSIFDIVSTGFREPDVIVPKLQGDKTSTVGMTTQRAEGTPKAVTGGVFSGISGFFDSVMRNPILLIIVMAVVILVIGKVF